MTKKELRYLIQRIKENKYLTRNETNYIIKALEQEHCEVAIDKAKVLDILRRHHREAGRDVDGDIVPGDYTEGIYDEIKALPPVTPIRKKCKLIKIGDRGFGYSDTVICKCSECEYKAEFTGKFDGLCLVVDMERAYKFCPNCSAEMEV